MATLVAINSNKAMVPIMGPGGVEFGESLQSGQVDGFALVAFYSQCKNVFTFGLLYKDPF